MSAERIPVMPRGVRCHFDGVRNTQVLLAPERALMLDQVGHAILSEIDGERTLAQLAADLAEKYQAPRDVIEKDMTEFLDTLADQRLIDYA